jgi:uncharacterized RmlC-like cupin family protein
VTRLIEINGIDQITGPQGQKLRPILTRDTAGEEPPFSILDVWMPPGGISVPHVHWKSPIAVRLLDGYGATLVREGESWTPYLHGPESLIYVPAGVLHCAVNLSDRASCFGIEVRSDPAGNEDVGVLPERQELVNEIGATLREQFADRMTQAAVSGRAPWHLG